MHLIPRMTECGEKGNAVANAPRTFREEKLRILEAIGASRAMMLRSSLLRDMRTEDYRILYRTNETIVAIICVIDRKDLDKTIKRLNGFARIFTDSDPWRSVEIRVPFIFL
jgi:hypothetical protein